MGFERKETSTKRGREYRAGLKRKALNLLGGKCSKCDYNRCIGALEFHHLDPSQKEITLNEALSNHWAWERIVEELSKCIVLYSNCHKEKHYTER